MATIYRTRQGEVLDLICLRHYRTQVGVVERVLEANPGLCERGPVLPTGTRITLPDIATATAPAAAATIKLWD